MATHGLRTRDLVGRLPRRHVGTGYRILAGKTTDPWTSTVLELCRALDVDPNELLGRTPSPLEPEIQALLDAAQGLSEEDHWLVVDMLRAVVRRRMTPCRFCFSEWQAQTSAQVWPPSRRRN